jgi:hypothetical protein
VADARNDASVEDDSTNNATSANQWQNSILDELPLAKEHLVFKFSMMDPGIKCLKIVALVNVNSISSAVIPSIIMALQDTLPMFSLEIGMATLDAAGCNWKSY